MQRSVEVGWVVHECEKFSGEGGEVGNAVTINRPLIVHFMHLHTKTKEVTWWHTRIFARVDDR